MEAFLSSSLKQIIFTSPKYKRLFVETFKDFSGHTFKMFYTEHGANASNLLMRFNIPAIESGQFTVRKELMGTDQQRYANVPFAYKAYKLLTPLDPGYIDGQHTYVLITSDAKYGMKVNPDGTVSNVASQNIPITFDNDGIFYLKPGETAIFTQLESVVYHVEELGIGETFHQMYPRVYINDTEVAGIQGAYSCEDDSVGNRPLVTFKNECGEYGVNDLRVTKANIEPPLNNGDMFEYRVMMETTGGVLRQYENGVYYVLDPEGNYCKFENGAYVPVTAAQAQVFHAGQYGSIARIPPGYTFEIRDILAGTHFYVDEIRVNEQGVVENAPLITATDWKLTNCVKENAADATAEMQGVSIYSYFSGGNVPISTLLYPNGSGALGRIREGVSETAHVTFTNSADTFITAKKVWDNNGFVTSHGPVQVALFETAAGSTELTLVSDTVRTLNAANNWTYTYTLVHPKSILFARSL